MTPRPGSVPEQRVYLDCSWATYQRLLAENANRPGTRLAYEDGRLEITVVQFGREVPNRLLAQLASYVAVETGRDFVNAGSTTFQREDLQKGFDPDSSFYFAAAQQIRGMKEVDLAKDPPPELIIEVDITRSSLNRFRIFAAVGVAEIWRYDGERVAVFRLADRAYEEASASRVLPPLTPGRITEFLDLGLSEPLPAWLGCVREWVRSASTS